MKQPYKYPASDKGFTLVELLVAMAVFIVIMVIAAQAFNSIITNSSKYAKMEETNIEGVIGLEIMRHDMEQMGFGLPWGWSQRDTSGTGTGDLIDSTISYLESTDTLGLKVNDATGNVPRAFVGIGKGSLTTTATYLGDFFGLKGTSVGRDKGSQRWTFVPYNNLSTSSGRVSQPVAASGSNPPRGGTSPDKVIAVNLNFNDTNKDHRLLIEPGSNTFFFINFSMTTITDNYLPATDQDTVLLYGIDGNTEPRMPFNRADYFVSTSGDVPRFCAPGTGVLYKATVNHGTTSSAGAYNPIPLLDCVADMRVVTGWDESADAMGSVNTFASLPTTVGGTPADVVGPGIVGTYMTSAEEIRKRLKVVKVYILAQEGKLDPTYQGPTTMVVGANPSAGDNSNNGLSTANNTYTFSTDQRQYRWKLYRIVVRPKNLVSNQR